MLDKVIVQRSVTWGLKMSITRDDTSHLPRPALGESIHQLIHELPLLLGTDLVAAAAHVERVIPEGLVAGPQIQSQGQGGLGTDPRTCCVEGQFPDGNAHPVDAQISQSEDAGAIGDTCDLHRGLRPIGDHGCQIAPIFPAQVHPYIGEGGLLAGLISCLDFSF